MRATDLVDFGIAFVVLVAGCTALAGVALLVLQIPPFRRLAARALEDRVEPGDGRGSVRDRLDLLQRGPRE